MSEIDVPAARPARAGLGSRALRNTALVLSAKVIARLIALVTVLYMIRKLGTAHYGSFTVLINLTAIVSVVLDLGFNVLFVREGARHHAEIQRYMRNVMSIRLLMSVVAFGLLAAIVYPLGLGELLVPGFLLMVFTSYASLLRNGLYAVQQLGWEAIAVVLESVVLLALVLYGGRTNQGVGYFVWAYAAQYAFSCVYFLIVLAVKRIGTPGWRFERVLLRQWFWKGLPFALTFVLTILYFRIDQPLIYVIRSEYESALYGAAYKPIESLLFVPITFLSVVFPVLAVYHRERPKEMIEAVNRFYKALFLMGCPTAIGIFVLAHPLTPLLLGHDFTRSEPALRVLALALGIGFVNNAFIGALNASDRQASFTWAAAWSLVANLALNLTLIPLFGYQGASWATVATEL
ncbi:MAG TPA: flippase, partial [Candidatus Dormibacteraeota bacterium]|nr:flippase [Candidatus Dormibacteraeota bacterium]